MGVPELADSGSFAHTSITTTVLVVAVFMGLDTLLVWVVLQIWRELRSLSFMVAKVPPVLMIAVLFFFVNGDIWRVPDALTLRRTIAVTAILGVLAILVIGTTVMDKTTKLLDKRQGDRMESFSDEQYEVSAADAGPEWEMALRRADRERPHDPTPVGRAEWYNLVSLPMLAQTIQSLLFGVVVCVFFIWFGTIAIPEATVTGWLGHEALRVSVGGTELPFSVVLVKVSMVLGAFAALNFVAQTAADQRYFEEFLKPTIDYLRQTVMLRNIARALS